MKFRKITISDKSAIESITHKLEPYSDFNFVSLIAWGVNDSALYKIENDVLWIKLRDYILKDKYIYSLFGKRNLQQAVDKFFDEHAGSKLELVAKEIIDKIDDSIYTFEHQRDEDDYIYDIDKTLAMVGPEYRKLRRSLSNFRTKNTFTPVFKQIEDRDEDVFKQVLELTKRWRNIRGRTFEEAAREYYAVRRALHFYEHLGVKLWVLLNQGELLGYVITENYGETALIHFEKGNTDVPGLGAYMKHCVFEEMRHAGCKFLNYEQDLGLGGLRRQKISLNPAYLLRKFTITRRY